MKTLSIITVCYNIKDEIEKTCESIINQTWQDFEWIVVDGGSTDGTLDILKKYKNRIDIFISEKDNGIYNAMNKGIKLANGKWLNFMNGGDSFYKNDVLEKVFKAENLQADILYGNCFCHHSDGSQYIKTFPEHIDKFFLCREGINHQSCFIKKFLFEKYGLYNEKYKIVADWEKWLIFADKNHQFKHIPFTVTNYSLDGLSSNKKMKRHHRKERLSVLNKHHFVRRAHSFYLFGFIPFLKIEIYDE